MLAAAAHSGTDWTQIGVILTAIFTGGIVAATIGLHWLDGRRISKERERREAVKELIGRQMDEITRSLRWKNTEDEYWDWHERTAALIDAALGRGEEHLFMRDVPAGGRMPEEKDRCKILDQSYERLVTLMQRWRD